MQLHPDLAHALLLAQQGREKEALGMIESLADAGVPDAIFTLADAYWKGVLVPKDAVRACDLFRRASEVGQPIARRAYTNLLASGHGGARDWRRALERLREEARSDVRRTAMLALIDQMDLDPEGNPRDWPPAEILSTTPAVSIFRGAFSHRECDFLTMIAEPTYEPSKVVAADGAVRAPVRTSDGSTIHWLIEDPATHALNRRLAALTGTDASQGEPLQILRYSPGQQYRPHLDWLAGDNPRVLTALVYLNDGYGGGETAFLKTGLKVRGTKGDLLVFRSQGQDGGLDPLSEHAGLPVTSGVKYLASRWIRAHPYLEDSVVNPEG